MARSRFHSRSFLLECIHRPTWCVSQFSFQVYLLAVLVTPVYHQVSIGQQVDMSRIAPVDRIGLRGTSRR